MKVNRRKDDNLLDNEIREWSARMAAARRGFLLIVGFWVAVLIIVAWWPR